MAKFRIPGTRMSEDEYRANLAGLNIFFGAVLGLRGALVVTILYIIASKHRVVYSVYALAAIALLPLIVEEILPPGVELPPKLQPTYIVWALFTIAVEFAPRTKPSEAEIDPA